MPLVMVGVLLFTSGLLAGALNLFKWLETGKWPIYSFLDVLQRGSSSGLEAWIANPTSWIGLHRALATQLDTGLLVAGGVLWLMGIFMMERDGDDV